MSAVSDPEGIILAMKTAWKEHPLYEAITRAVDPVGIADGVTMSGVKADGSAETTQNSGKKTFSFCARKNT